MSRELLFIIVVTLVVSALMTYVVITDMREAKENGHTVIPFMDIITLPFIRRENESLWDELSDIMESGQELMCEKNICGNTLSIRITDYRLRIRYAIVEYQANVLARKEGF